MNVLTVVDQRCVMATITANKITSLGKTMDVDVSRSVHGLNASDFSLDRIVPSHLMVNSCRPE